MMNDGISCTKSIKLYDDGQRKKNYFEYLS